ncbi:MAG: DUF1214 domain-containing protein [Rhodobacteraceae bacterium]|nr:DUF1214 domain-containing protein [Paracoccaceae bacterium]
MTSLNSSHEHTKTRLLSLDDLIPATVRSETDGYTSDLPRILQPRRPTPVRTLLRIVLVLISGVLLGISTAYVAIERERPFLAVTIGPWSAYPKAGTPEADPYSVAIYTRSARIPMAPGEGLTMTARTDSAGYSLDPACTYRIAGATPTARLWTLTANNRYGRLFETTAERHGINSSQILYKENGDFVIYASSQPHSGNWLPLAPDPASVDGMMLTFRLYDAPITTSSALTNATMPDIVQVGCS